MNGAEFKKRYIKSLPSVPEELNLKLDEFVLFDSQTLESSGLSEKDKEFLLEAGLPRDASPFLSFQAYSLKDISRRKEVFGIDESFFPIGHNGSGDPIVIDTKSGEVLYFNHDYHMKKVFINSSLRQFAETLCVQQENRTSNTLNKCLEEISHIDAPAVAEDTMWYSEIQMELGDG